MSLRVYLLSIVIWVGVAAALVVGCGPSASNDDQNNNENSNVACEEGTTRCDSSSTVVEICQEGDWQVDTYCSGTTPVCYDGQCVLCTPDSRYCDAHQVFLCSSDGTESQLVQACDTAAGEICSAGNCLTLCDQAEQRMSYIGCEYWPTPVANTVNEMFANDFTVVVHNANQIAALVTITKGQTEVAQETIQPGEIRDIPLTYDQQLKSDDSGSVNVADGAFRLVSSMPITVYQFNPFNFLSESNPQTYSMSNDASLLLPSHVFSVNYMVMSRPTLGINTGVSWEFRSGVLAVVATQANTLVTITSTAYTQGGTGIAAMTPGQSSQFSLTNPGDVLEIFSEAPSDCSSGQQSSCIGTPGAWECCSLGPEYDLTGTVIEASAPVAVFAGHECTFIPYNYYACDHLEEQMIPAEAWGEEFIVTRTEPQSPDTPEPNVIKVLSREDNNTITFYPASVHEAVTLGKGEYVELQTGEDFRMVSTEPMMVAQFTVSQNFYTALSDYWGDPAFGLVVPFEQYRDSYSFAMPSTMTYNYVNIIAEIGSDGMTDPGIMLDGQAVSFTGSNPIGESEYGVVTVDLSASVSQYHTITGNSPFGIMVYGFAQYTSYLYPGGLDLEYINPIQ